MDRPKATRVRVAAPLTAAIAAVALAGVVVLATELRRLSARLEEVYRAAKAADSRASNAFLHATMKGVALSEVKN